MPVPPRFEVLGELHVRFGGLDEQLRVRGLEVQFTEDQVAELRKFAGVYLEISDPPTQSCPVPFEARTVTATYPKPEVVFGKRLVLFGRDPTTRMPVVLSDIVMTK